MSTSRHAFFLLLKVTRPPMQWTRRVNRGTPPKAMNFQKAHWPFFESRRTVNPLLLLLLCTQMRTSHEKTWFPLARWLHSFKTTRNGKSRPLWVKPWTGKVAISEDRTVNRQFVCCYCCALNALANTQGRTHTQNNTNRAAWSLSTQNNFELVASFRFLLATALTPTHAPNSAARSSKLHCYFSSAITIVVWRP